MKQTTLALVTGGSRGIGRAIAVALARAGHDVAINYRRDHAAAASAVAEIEALGRRAAAFPADVSEPDEVDRLAAAIEAQLGEPGVLVNNAGIAQTRTIDEITTADWDAMMHTNVRSAFLVTQRFLPAMRRRGWGRLLFLSSVAAQAGGVVGPHYAASKAALLGLMHFYASRLAPEGITANAIAPALIATEMLADLPAATPARIPAGRFGTADEVATAAVMLAGNGYITGQTINVNGGWILS